MEIKVLLVATLFGVIAAVSHAAERRRGTADVPAPKA